LIAIQIVDSYYYCPEFFTLGWIGGSSQYWVFFAFARWQ